MYSDFEGAREIDRSHCTLSLLEYEGTREIDRRFPRAA